METRQIGRKEVIRIFIVSCNHMRTDIQKQLFLAGLGLFVLGVAGALMNLAVLLLVLYLLPGIFLGVIISANIESTRISKILFILSSALVYYLVIYGFTELKNVLDLRILRILIPAAMGTVLIKYYFDILFRHQRTLRHSVLLPLLTGASSSLFAAFTLEFSEIPFFSGSKINELLFWSGILSAYPIWFYTFAYLLKDVATANSGLPKARHNACSGA